MENLDGYELDCVIEAILFASGEPVEIAALADGLGVGNLIVETTLQKMADDYAFQGRGIRIIRLEDSVQMCTATEYAPYIKHILYTRNQHMRLSPAAMEVLAIIAYNQPVTRAYIEQIRRVDCTGVLAGLSEKGLIREDGQLDVPGHPNLYVVTSEFLRCFGLSSMADLPELPELSLPEQAEQSAAEENAGRNPEAGDGQTDQPVSDILSAVKDGQTSRPASAVSFSAGDRQTGLTPGNSQPKPGSSQPKADERPFPAVEGKPTGETVRPAAVSAGENEVPVPAAPTRIVAPDPAGTKRDGGHAAAAGSTAAPDDLAGAPQTADSLWQALQDEPGQD